MLQIAYTMHRGKVCRQQQDCILVDGAIHQVPVLPITASTLAADEVLLAVADGVAASGGDRRIAPQQARRIVLEELAKAVRERPEWLREGFVANRHVRLVQARLSDKLAGNHETYGAASTLAVAHVRSYRAAILNVGDSRVYQVNQEGQWWRLSKDHTVLQDLLDRGEASPDTEYASLYGMLAHVLCA
ncbi:MAG TPA: protein phosphatase 2C domain-containing protein, partial [Candidatus Competibacter sp.]|nr:protein phosphatase 2C domain-containing protein [Candidatus Competibacter sp.]